VRREIVPAVPSSKKNDRRAKAARFVMNQYSSELGSSLFSNPCRVLESGLLWTPCFCILCFFNLPVLEIFRK